MANVEGRELTLAGFIRERLTADHANAERLRRRWHLRGRLIRLVHAKLEILEQCEALLLDGPDQKWDKVGTCDRVLRDLGVVYSHHPDYRAEWLPWHDEKPSGSSGALTT